MSNQRVVVLTDEEIEGLLKEGQTLESRRSRVLCRIKLRAALEQPEGITDEMVERFCEYKIDNREDVTHEDLARRLLAAALFPGEDGER